MLPMRVLFSHPYHLALDPREAEVGRPYPPLQTLVAAAVARQAGHEVVLHDPMFEPNASGFGGVLDRIRPEAVCLVADDHSVAVKQCLGSTRAAHLEMAVACRDRGIPVLVSGPDVSDHPELFLAGGATVAVSGEAVVLATEWLAGDAGLEGLHGAGGGGGRRGPVADPDALPVAAWDLVDLADYARRWRQRHGYWELNIWTARGCPYRCNWCAKPVWGRGYQVRRAEAVVAELAMLRAQHQPDRIWFTDDIFALRPAWLREFRRLVEPIPYRALSRADLLKDPAYVANLAASGCREVWLGAESGSDAVLQAMDKDETVEEIRLASGHLKTHGIQSCFFLQLGYPGESLEDVRATVRLVRECKPDMIGVSVSSPLPGTTFYERVQASLHGEAWTESNENRPRFGTPFEAPFYELAREVLRSTWSAGHAPEAVRAFLAAPGRQTARRVAGAAFHRVRLPLVTRRMERAARPNPEAVPRSW